MASVRYNMKFCLRPCSVEIPCCLHWSDDVISSLYDGGGDVPYGVNVVYKRVLLFKPTSMDKIVTGVCTRGRRQLLHNLSVMYVHVWLSIA